MCTPNTASTPRIGTVVAALCFTAVVLDGYDLIIYGAVVPSLLSYPEWHLSAEQAGAYGSYALIGMLIGAVSSGLITDVLGRRKLMLICTTWFSIGTALCALAPTPELFGVLRFLAGLGLGGLLPTAISLTNEYAPPHRKQLYNGAMTTGYAVGGIVASLLALLLIPTFGFRSVFLAGGAPIIVLFPLLSRYLPESASFLSSRGRVDEARTLLARYGLPPVMDQPAEPRHAHEQAPARLLFSTPYLRPTLIFGAANFCGLLLSYGMSTWLPATMRTAGYALNSSLAFLLTLNVGAIIGVITGSLIADRIGSRITISSCYLIAGICIALLSASPPIFVLYLLVAISGFGAIGTQILLNGYVANYYPTRARGSALGWSLGVGRVGGICGPLVGGLIIGAAIGFQWNFYVFGLTAVLAGTLVAFIAPQRPELTSPEPFRRRREGRGRMRRDDTDLPFDPSQAAGARAVSRLSLGEALRNQALARPNAVAIVHPTGRLSYRELDETSTRLARALIDRGIGIGDRVAVLTQNCVEYVLLQHAVAKLGAIMVSLNWRWQTDELRHAIELVSPTIVFTSPDHHDRASAAVADTACPPKIVPFDRSNGAITAVPLDGYGADPLGLDIDPERIVTILYTSGTTGRPKAAAMSHRAYVARAGRDAAVLGLSHHDAHIAWGPMYHMVSADYIFIMCLLGGTYIIVPGFDVDAINQHLHEWDLGWLIVMPGAIGQLVDRVRQDPRPPRRIRCLGAMADLIPPGQIAQATAALRAPFLNSFGLTETGLTTGSLIPVGVRPSDLAKTFSAFFDTRLVDPADPTRDVPDGTAGELLLRGATLFSGYWNDAEATSAALAGGWFHTGDLLVREADGRMNVVGRAKYMIKSGGENVYPAEIERVLLSHPEVSEACVVKRADGHWGEVPVAFVAAPPELSAEALREYCRAYLAGYKLPRSIVHLELDRFPRNITGKVLREELETRARDLPATGQPAQRTR